MDLDEIIVGNNNAVNYNVPSPEEVSAPRGEKRKHSDDPDDSSQSPSNGFLFSTPAKKRVKKYKKALSIAGLETQSFKNLKSPLP